MTSRSKIIKMLLFTPNPEGRWGLNAVWHGRPGTAKTAHVREVACTHGLPCETIIAAIRQPDDFLGIPTPSTFDGIPGARYLLGPWVIRLIQAGRGVAFFDEICRAPLAVQNALLRVLHEGCVGDEQLPIWIRFMMATNAADHGGYDLDPALANRSGHFDWDVPTSDEWGAWALGRNFGPSTNGASTRSDEDLHFDPVAEENRVLDESPTPFGLARGSVISFIRRRPDFLLKEPPIGSPDASKAWPSLRSWANATWALAGCSLHSLNEEERNTVLAAFIGAGAAKEFVTFLSTLDLPDPEDLLAGKSRWKHNPKRLDQTCAVLTSCSAFLLAKKNNRSEYASKLWELINHTAATGDADVTVPAATALVEAKLGLENGNTIEAARPALKKLGRVITGAERRAEKET